MHATAPHFFHAIQGNQKLGAHSIAPRLCPPLLPTVTTMTTTVVKRTMARGRPQRSMRRSCTASSGTDFCHPPPLIGWALTKLCRGKQHAPDDNDNKDDNNVCVQLRHQWGTAVCNTRGYQSSLHIPPPPGHFLTRIKEF
jgi:hypothetical protein